MSLFLNAGLNFRRQNHNLSSRRRRTNYAAFFLFKHSMPLPDTFTDVHALNRAFLPYLNKYRLEQKHHSFSTTKRARRAQHTSWGCLRRAVCRGGRLRGSGNGRRRRCGTPPPRGGRVHRRRAGGREERERGEEREERRGRRGEGREGGGQQDTSVSSSSMCPKYTEVYFRASSAKQVEIGDGVDC